MQVAPTNYSISRLRTRGGGDFWDRYQFWILLTSKALKQWTSNLILKKWWLLLKFIWKQFCISFGMTFYCSVMLKELDVPMTWPYFDRHVFKLWIFKVWIGLNYAQFSWHESSLVTSCKVGYFKSVEKQLELGFKEIH